LEKVGRVGLKKYNRGYELVQSTLYTCMDYHNETPYTTMYAKKKKSENNYFSYLLMNTVRKIYEEITHLKALYKMKSIELFYFSNDYFPHSKVVCRHQEAFCL
jgi:hypothetical protein